MSVVFDIALPGSTLNLVFLSCKVVLCVCLYVSVSLWVFMGVGGLVCFIIVVLSLCEALCVAFKV